jgi:hypothetical protein
VGSLIPLNVKLKDENKIRMHETFNLSRLFTVGEVERFCFACCLRERRIYNRKKFHVYHKLTNTEISMIHYDSN